MIGLFMLRDTKMYEDWHLNPMIDDTTEHKSIRGVMLYAKSFKVMREIRRNMRRILGKDITKYVNFMCFVYLDTFWILGFLTVTFIQYAGYL